MKVLVGKLVRVVRTGFWIATCSSCGKSFRTKKVRKGQVRYCSCCGREKGLLSYARETEEVADAPNGVHSYLNFAQADLFQVVASSMPCGHELI